jgi:hypothetical protein
MADNLSVESTRKAHSMSVGEVSAREHKEGESEDHFESSSREFTNPNHCHAVTFLFYRINKTEKIHFELIAVERRVLDAAAPTPVLANPMRAFGQIATVPQEVPATNKTRLEIEARGLQSVAQQTGEDATPVPPPAIQLPLSDVIRKAALAQVDKQLVDRNLLDPNTGNFSKQARTQFEFSRTSSLPTAGIIVKGCLDTCDICEPEVQRKLQLELDQLELQNQLLKRQIELLDKSQEYRCCPADEEETAT